MKQLDCHFVFVLLIHASVEFISLTALFLPLIVQLSFEETFTFLIHFKCSIWLILLENFFFFLFNFPIFLWMFKRWIYTPAPQEIFFSILVRFSFWKETSILIFVRVNLFAQHFTSLFVWILNFRDETWDGRIRSLTNIEFPKQRDDVASNFSLEFSSKILSI